MYEPINDNPIYAGAARSSAAGYSLVELMIVVVIISIIAAIAIPQYSEAINAAKIVRAMGDIKTISTEIDMYSLRNNQYPNTLADVGYDDRKDPWGQPYQYLNDQEQKGNGKVRKDKNLVPLNSDYDLYSMGRDGESVSPITAQASRDDILRANNGGFIGLAANY
jgi:general secretion pathway protein G